MEEAAYRAMVNSRPYNGLQLIHMDYKEAYDFAGEYGMNAIVATTKPPYQMFMCRLNQASDGKLRIRNRYIDGQSTTNFNANILSEDMDIYWIGLR